MSELEFVKIFNVVKNKRKNMETLMELKYLMFENEKNNCWLDASVALIAHNKTFKKIAGCVADSQINKIISTHTKAVSILNDSVGNIEQRIKKTRELLTDIQNSTLVLLKQFLKFKPGEPDSAFCALLNLIFRDTSDIKEHLNASWIWRKSCTNCGTNSKSATCIKPIITLSKVNKFQPEYPTSIYMCRCKTEQEMKLIYKELPSCLIFHFENGAGNGENFPLSFSVNGRKYQLTCIVLLEKSNDPNLNHFVTWIRDPSFNVWLDCNDLNTTIVSFSPKPPELNLKDVYMYVFESFDNLDKIKNEISVDQEQDIESCNVEVIDLSEEEPKGSSESTSCKPDASKSSNNENSSNSTIDAPTDAIFSTKKEDGPTSTSILNPEKPNENDSPHTSLLSKLLEDKEHNRKSITHADDDVLKLKSKITNISDSKNVATSDFKNGTTSDSKNVNTSDSKNVNISNSKNVSTSDSKNVNTLDSKNISTFDKKKSISFSKIYSSAKDSHCKENDADKSTAIDSLSVKNEQVLNDTLPKTSEETSIITGSSNIFKKNKKAPFSSGNKNLPRSNVKKCEVQKSELGCVVKIKKDKQSARNKSILFDSVKCSDAENSQSMEQLEVQIACSRKEDEQNCITNSSNIINMISPKSETISSTSQTISSKKEIILPKKEIISSKKETISSKKEIISSKNETNVDDKKLSEQKQKTVQSIQKITNINGIINRESVSKGRQTSKTCAEFEKREACGYENKLKLKMQQTSIKKTESVDSSKKKKITIANLQHSNVVNDVVSKTSESLPEVPKSIKRKNLKKNDEVTNQNDKLSVNEDCRNDVPKSNKRKNLKRNEVTNLSNKLSAYAANTNENNLSQDERLERHVDIVVENTFAAFLKQVCDVYEIMS